MTDINSIIRSIRDLAAVRHPEAQQVSINLTVDYSLARDVGIVLKDGAPLSSTETSDPAPWAAQVRLGGGKWGHVVTPARTPLDALRGLHAHYVACHRSVDAERRAILASADALVSDAGKVSEPVALGLARAKERQECRMDGVKEALRAMTRTNNGGEAWEAVKALLPAEEAEAMQKEAEEALAWARQNTKACESGTFGGNHVVTDFRDLIGCAKSNS